MAAPVDAARRSLWRRVVFGVGAALGCTNSGHAAGHDQRRVRRHRT
jgi:hypothetical protein